MIPRLGDGNCRGRVSRPHKVQERLENDSPSRGRKHKPVFGNIGRDDSSLENDSPSRGRKQ